MIQLAAGFASGLIAVMSTHAAEEKPMSDPFASLWGVVSELEAGMPLSVEAVEAISGVHLERVDQTEGFIQYHARGRKLESGLELGAVNLMLNGKAQFDDRAGLALEIGGGCISLDEIRRRFGQMEMTQHPRGQSPMETAVWSSIRPWGNLSFAFRQDRPDCLFRISFRKKSR